MKKRALIAGAAAILVAGAVAAGTPSRAASRPDAAAVAPFTTPSPVGCQNSVRFRNTGSRDIYVDLNQSFVRIFTGWWKSLSSQKSFWAQGPLDEGFTIKPGDDRWVTFDVTFDCKRYRKWRFYLKQGSSTYTKYYPSSKTWSLNTRIDLGDLDRFF